MYSDLRPEHQEFRLLELIPGQPDDDIEGRLFCSTLQEKKRYEALSYSWGCTNTEYRISVNGISKIVTANLYCALRRLRHQFQPRVIWVDAICINQDNVAEREHQVSLMGEIYRNCSKGLIWLGEHEYDEDEGKFIHGESPVYGSVCQWGDTEIATRILTEKKVPKTVADCYEFAFATIVLLAQNSHVLELPIFLQDIQPTEHTSTACATNATAVPSDIDKVPGWRTTASAIMLLLSRTYWTRVWILQEIVLSPSASVHFGAHVIPLNVLLIAQKCLSKHYYTCCKQWGYEAVGKKYSAFTGIIEQFEIAEQLRRLRALARSSSPKTLYDTVDALTEKGKCSDPRDQIHGLLGITQMHNSGYVLPNYTEDVAQVYTKAMYNIILERKDFLALKYLDRGRSEKKKLPTWVPDWSFSLDLSPGPYDWSLFQVSLRLPFYANLVDGSVLETRGLIIDEVRKTKKRMVFEDRSLTAFLQCLIDWHLSSVKEGKSASESMKDFLRTIFADTLTDATGTSRRLTLEDLENILSWWRYTLGLYKTEASSKEWGALSMPEEYTDIFETLKRRVRSRRLFITKKERTGMGVSILSEHTDDNDVRREVRVGDVVCLLGGCNVPVVLRPFTSVATGPGKQSPHRYSYVGSCYLDGVMDGEAASSESSAPHLIHITGNELASLDSTSEGRVKDSSGALQLIISHLNGSGGTSRTTRSAIYRNMAYYRFHAVAGGMDTSSDPSDFMRDLLIPALNSRILGKVKLPNRHSTGPSEGEEDSGLRMWYWSRDRGVEL